MAAGKTTVGALLAERLGMAFADLDQEIERATGQSIRALFEYKGESEFRAIEREQLARLIDNAEPMVIATGGGAPCHGDNLARMRARGLVIALDVSLAGVRARVADPSSRPLLARSDDQLEALYQTRRAFYLGAHAFVPTEIADGRADSVCHAVWHVVERAHTIADDLLPHTNLVALGERSYPVITAPGVLQRLGGIARASLGQYCTRAFVISDDQVAPLYAGAARQSLERAGFSTSLLTVPAGEASKSFAQVERLCTELSQGGVSRSSVVVALGGGVIGDLAGLVAAVSMRGIPVIQVPTSLLAMVDAAIGGKTGIDLPAGKNLVGAFWQPSAVVADPLLLATLPVRERRAAAGELVKYGLLVGEALYAAIERLAPDPWAPDPLSMAEGDADAVEADAVEALCAVIRSCVAYKSAIVSQDERDRTGARALLNLGHTIGHAIEAASGFGPVLHGEAVALGLVAACRVSNRVALGAVDLEARVAATLARFGLATEVESWLGPDTLIHVAGDKKRAGEAIDFIAIERVGGCRVVRVPVLELTRILRTDFTV
jgi:shikimate kinase/3-dehydroquinate synthase